MPRTRRPARARGCCAAQAAGTTTAARGRRRGRRGPGRGHPVAVFGGPAAAARQGRRGRFPDDLADTVVTCGGGGLAGVSHGGRGPERDRRVRRPGRVRAARADAGIDAPRRSRSRGAEAPYVVLSPSPDAGHTRRRAVDASRVQDDARRCHPGAGRRTATAKRPAGVTATTSRSRCRRAGRGSTCPRPRRGRSGDHHARGAGERGRVHERAGSRALSRRTEGRRDRRPGARHARQRERVGAPTQGNPPSP